MLKPHASRDGTDRARLSDAAAEWLRYCEHERACKKSTLTEYRHAADVIVRGVGDPPLEDVTPEMIERWKGSGRTAPRRPQPKRGPADAVKPRPVRRPAIAPAVTDELLRGFTAAAGHATPCAIRSAGDASG